MDSDLDGRYDESGNQSDSSVYMDELGDGACYAIASDGVFSPMSQARKPLAHRIKLGSYSTKKCPKQI